MSYIYDLVKRTVSENGTSDPFELCDALGITCIHEDMGGLTGLLTYIGDEPAIIISSRIGREERRLACAHEIGHCLLHSDIAREGCLKEFEIFNMKDKVEYEANIFAAHLLIDDDELLRLLQEGRDVFETAMMLGVNPNLLNIKLIELNGMGYGFDTSWAGTRPFE